MNIADWGALDEHNTNRRGFVAYGQTTHPADVPATGVALYRALRARPVRAQRDRCAGGLRRHGDGDGGLRHAHRDARDRRHGEGRRQQHAGAGGDDNEHAGGGDRRGCQPPRRHGDWAPSRAGSALAGGPVATGSGAGPAEIGGVLALSGSGAQAGATLLTGFIARKQ
ncbi:MAG: hypothetical protein U1F25_00985 [Rubrivivax sp.]